MTCIVAMIDPKTNTVVVGGDTLSVDAHNLSCGPRSDEKVFRNGPYVIGYTTSFRMGQLLRYNDLPVPDTWDVNRFMVTTFIDAVRGIGEAKGFMSKNDGHDQFGTFIVGFEDKLYIVYDDLQVAVNADGLAACGCGQDLALGAARALIDNTDLSPEEVVLEALKAASIYSAGVRGPYTIMSTELP